MADPQVAHVTTVHRPSDTRIAMKECEALVRSGIETCLIAQEGTPPPVDGLTYVRLPKRIGRIQRVLRGSTDAWRALKVLQPAVVQVHDPELIPLAILFKLRHNVKVVYDSHEELPKQIMGKEYIPRLLRRPMAAIGALLEKLADKFLDGIVAATPAIARNYRNENTILVQNYPWRDSYDESYTPVIPDENRAVYVGAISLERGAREMIESVQQVREPAELILAGPMSSSAKELLRGTKSERVKYVGSLPVTDIPNLLATTTVGLVLFHALPNHVEAQPTKIYEYMAAGRPFIASNFPAWIDSFGDLKCGLFVDPTNVTEIKNAIESLVVDRKMAKEMGVRGREAFCTRFVFDVEAPRLLAQTTALLGQHCNEKPTLGRLP